MLCYYVIYIKLSFLLHAFLKFGFKDSVFRKAINMNDVFLKIVVLCFPQKIHRQSAQMVNFYGICAENRKFIDVDFLQGNAEIKLNLRQLSALL